MIPCMSSMSKQSPEKIRDCVGIDGIVKVIVDLVETEVSPFMWDSCVSCAVEFSRTVCVR